MLSAKVRKQFLPMSVYVCIHNVPITVMDYMHHCTVGQVNYGFNMALIWQIRDAWYSLPVEDKILDSELLVKCKPFFSPACQLLSGNINSLSHHMPKQDLFNNTFPILL